MAGGIKFGASVIVPEFGLEILNEAEAVAAMAHAIALDVGARADRGVGAAGALPKPKAGGTAYKSTGLLISSISAQPSKRNPKRWTVFATGDRPKDEGGKEKAKRARKRTKNLRAARVRDALANDKTGRLASLGKRALGKELKLGKLRRRAATTNAALAGILSVQAKDKRAKNGDRGEYRVFEANDRYRRIGQRAAARHTRVELRSKGERVIK